MRAWGFGEEDESTPTLWNALGFLNQSEDELQNLNFLSWKSCIIANFHNLFVKPKW